MDLNAVFWWPIAVLQSACRFLSILLSSCQIKPCILQPDGHLDPCKDHKVYLFLSHVYRFITLPLPLLQWIRGSCVYYASYQVIIWTQSKAGVRLTALLPVCLRKTQSLRSFLLMLLQPDTHCRHKNKNSRNQTRLKDIVRHFFIIYEVINFVN